MKNIILFDKIEKELMKPNLTKEELLTLLIENYDFIKSEGLIPEFLAAINEK